MSDCIQLVLASGFLLIPIHLNKVTNGVLSPLKFSLWTISIFLIQLIYLTIPFAKRGNMNRVFTATI